MLCSSYPPMRLLLWASIGVAQLGTVTAQLPCTVLPVPGGANPGCAQLTGGVLVHGQTCEPTCDAGFLLSNSVECDDGGTTPFTCDTDVVDGYQKMSSDGRCQRNGNDLAFIMSQVDVLNVQECAVACTHVNECAGFSIQATGYKVRGCHLQVPGKDLTYPNDYFLDKLNPQQDVSFTLTSWAPDTPVTSNDDSDPIDGTDDTGGWKCYKKNSYPNCVALKPMCCEAQKNTCWQPSSDPFKCSTASECVGCLGIVLISDLEFLACPAAAANDAPSPPAAAPMNAPSPPTAGGAINGVVNSENNTKASSGMSDEALVAILIALGAIAVGAGGYTVYKKGIVKKLMNDAYKNFFLRTKPVRGITVNLM